MLRLLSEKVSHTATDGEIIAAATALGFPKFVPHVCFILRVPVDTVGVFATEAEVTVSASGGYVVIRHYHDADN